MKQGKLGGEETFLSLFFLNKSVQGSRNMSGWGQLTKFVYKHSPVLLTPHRVHLVLWNGHSRRSSYAIREYPNPQHHILFIRVKINVEFLLYQLTDCINNVNKINLNPYLLFYIRLLLNLNRNISFICFNGFLFCFNI